MSGETIYLTILAAILLVAIVADLLVKLKSWKEKNRIKKEQKTVLKALTADLKAKLDTAHKDAAAHNNPLVYVAYCKQSEKILWGMTGDELTMINALVDAGEKDPELEEFLQILAKYYVSKYNMK